MENIKHINATLALLDDPIKIGITYEDGSYHTKEISNIEALLLMAELSKALVNKKARLK